MADHTPAPWRLQTENPAKIEIICSDRLAPIHKPSGNRVAEIRPKRIGRGGAFNVSNVDKANAKLIAKAPELLLVLEELDALLDFSDEEPGTVWTFDDTADIIKAFAQAKALLNALRSDEHEAKT